MNLKFSPWYIDFIINIIETHSQTISASVWELFD